MSTQPEALRLAEILEGGSDQFNAEATAELRRLHAENQQITEYADALNDRCVKDAERIGALLEALKTVEWHGAGSCWVVDADKVDAAIKAAEENSNGNV